MNPPLLLLSDAGCFTDVKDCILVCSVISSIVLSGAITEEKNEKGSSC